MSTSQVAALLVAVLACAVALRVQRLYAHQAPCTKIKLSTHPRDAAAGIARIRVCNALHSIAINEVQLLNAQGEAIAVPRCAVDTDQSHPAALQLLDYKMCTSVRTAAAAAPIDICFRVPIPGVKSVRIINQAYNRDEPWVWGCFATTRAVVVNAGGKIVGSATAVEAAPALEVPLVVRE